VLASQAPRLTSSQGLSVRHVQGCLLAIGFTCEELAADCLEQSAVDQLLGVLVTAASDAAAPDVRLCALQALRNALQFAGDNFKVHTPLSGLRAFCVQG
jgi:hypothetical protein